jgi:cob(I)alamin adenosyltransferase
MGLFSNKEYTFDMVTTKGGDNGKSSLLDGQRLYKDDDYFQVVGDLDELSSFLGMVRENHSVKFIDTIQRDLIQIAGTVASKESSEERKEYVQEISLSDIIKIEKEQKKLNPKIATEFISPGEFAEKKTAVIDVARSVCRRAERSLVDLIRRRGRRDLIICQKYLNRLSDYLFMLARKKEQ